MMTTDMVLPFYLTGDEGSQPKIRGRIARLHTQMDQIIGRHGYNDVVSGLCAETLALTSVLSSMMSFEGVFTVQAKGDGAVRTLMADMTDEGAMRCYAAFDEDDALLQGAYQGPALLPRLCGSGYMAFTVDHQVTNRRYQGIVELDGPHLGDAATSWYNSSEQLKTLIITMAEKTSSGWVSSALLLQHIATSGGKMTDDLYAQPEEMDEAMSDLWHTAMTLCGSVKSEELLEPSLGLDTIIYRLFNALGPHVQPAKMVTDSCRCSDDKVRAMLEGLSAAQRADVADEAGGLAVACEFCKTERLFTLTDFAAD